MFISLLLCSVLEFVKKPETNFSHLGSTSQRDRRRLKQLRSMLQTLEELDGPRLMQLLPKRAMVVICGATGTGKTMVSWRGGNQVGSGPCLVEDVCHS